MTTIVIPLSKKSDDWKSIHSHLDGYLHGKCYPFAIMLHENFGWQIIGIVEKGVVQHAGARTPDGKIFDARGFVTEEEFVTPFKLSRTCKIKPIKVDQIDLRVKDPSSTRSVEEDMDFAEKVSRRLWPELPWKDNFIERAKKFADELEELSKKYGVYISYPITTCPPILFEMDGGEGGYTISQLPLGNFSITRRLGL